MGMINYYHSCIPKFAHMLSPIYETVTTAMKTKDKHLQWTEDIPNAAIKNRFANQLVLNHFNNKAKLSIAVDASNTAAIGGILQQEHTRLVEPVFLFKILQNPSETKYLTFDCELVSIFFIN